jgi:hypothetical protein
VTVQPVSVCRVRTALRHGKQRRMGRCRSGRPGARHERPAGRDAANARTALHARARPPAAHGFPCAIKEQAPGGSRETSIPPGRMLTTLSGRPPDDGWLIGARAASRRACSIVSWVPTSGLAPWHLVRLYVPDPPLQAKLVSTSRGATWARGGVAPRACHASRVTRATFTYVRGGVVCVCVCVGEDDEGLDLNTAWTTTRRASGSVKARQHLLLWNCCTQKYIGWRTGTDIICSPQFFKKNLKLRCNNNQPVHPKLKKPSTSHKLTKHPNIIKQPQTLQPSFHTLHCQKKDIVESMKDTGLTRQGSVCFSSR